MDHLMWWKVGMTEAAEDHDRAMALIAAKIEALIVRLETMRAEARGLEAELETLRSRRTGELPARSVYQNLRAPDI
jgi:hypothetical protein